VDQANSWPSQVNDGSSASRVSSVIFQIFANLCTVKVSHTKMGRKNMHRENDCTESGRTNIH
jgi:hypothetical protein